MKNSLYITSGFLLYMTVCFALLSFYPHSYARPYKSEATPTKKEIIRRKGLNVNVLESKAKLLAAEVQSKL